MRFGLIIVGDEILSGKRIDQHLPRVIQILAARGLALHWARYVGDDPERLTADLADAFAASRADGRRAHPKPPETATICASQQAVRGCERPGRGA